MLILFVDAGGLLVSKNRYHAGYCAATAAAAAASRMSKLRAREA
jgi:hypothetical protein